MDGVNELDENVRFQTFWIQARKNKPLGEICKTGQTSGTKMPFYSHILEIICIDKKRLNNFQSN
ncbi:hypothetical protein Hanom_Chr15g01344901 [Helianthus anomalus]